MWELANDWQTKIQIKFIRIPILLYLAVAKHEAANTVHEINSNMFRLDIVISITSIAKHSLPKD